MVVTELPTAPLLLLEEQNGTVSLCSCISLHPRPDITVTDTEHALTSSQTQPTQFFFFFFVTFPWKRKSQCVGGIPKGSIICPDQQV